MFRKMKIMQIFLQNQFESYYNRKLKPTLWFKIIITWKYEYWREIAFLKLGQ